MEKFNVLWFEDNIKDFNDEIPYIQQHCSMINRVFEYDHFDHYPDDFNVMLFDGRYSLVLIDLNLKNGQKGSQIIKILREYGAFMDVLLYSNNPGELINLTEGKNYVEGIYRHATLREIEKKICDVIDQINYKEIMTIDRYQRS